MKSIIISLEISGSRSFYLMSHNANLRLQLSSAKLNNSMNAVVRAKVQSFKTIQLCASSYCWYIGTVPSLLVSIEHYPQ